MKPRPPVQNSKFEIRNSKEIRRSKFKASGSAGWLRVVSSGDWTNSFSSFGFRISFGFRAFEFRILALAFLPLLASAFVSFADTPAGWGTDFTNALAQAQARRQPVLAYFTASWCGPCKMMARTTLTNEAVIQALTNFSHVAVDIDEQRELAQQHGVRAVPTFQLLAANGDEISSTTGYQDAARFLHWLTNGVREAQEAATRRKQFEEKLAGTDRLLQQPEAESLKSAAAELFDLCSERSETISRPATERLAKLAVRDPRLLLDGLNHPRLAARIQAANVLRAQLGEAFDVDPWSDAATRRDAIAQWRQKLASYKPAAPKVP
jgi:thioredoxin-like negative regulator of GroEL